MIVDFVAFYGTLRHDHHTPVSSAAHAGLHYMGPCLIPGKLYDRGRLNVLVPGDSHVAGELYAIVNPGIMASLDHYEAKDDAEARLPGFSRHAVRLIDPEIKAWVYWYDGPVTELQRLA